MRENIKYILITPTWSSKKRKKIGIDVFKLIEKLPKEYEIIIKFHPNEAYLTDIYLNKNPTLTLTQF